MAALRAALRARLHAAALKCAELRQRVSAVTTDLCYCLSVQAELEPRAQSGSKKSKVSIILADTANPQ